MENKDNIHILSRAVILDQEHILLCKTLDLKINFYFLPGGHVEHGESVATALPRELFEETGAQISIERLLGCLEYSFEPGHNSICHNHEYNFIFKACSNELKINKITPQCEAHIELIWMQLDKITEIDFRAKPLQTLLPQWLKQPTNNLLFQSFMKE